VKSFESGPVVASPRFYFRTVKHGVSGTEVSEALTEILKQDEVRIKDGKWRLVAPVERRTSA
jgi:hypothetical protein